MKRLISFILAVMMIVAAVPVVQSSAITAEESLPYLTYQIIDNEVMVTDCSMSATEIVVPDFIEGYPVTRLSTRVFYDCTNLRSVVLPESVKSIGERAFYNCKSLVSVNIPQGITVIEKYMFYKCASLKELDIPSSVSAIKESAFYGCGFETFTVPENITSLERSLFAKCASLKEINIHDEVTSVGRSVFSGCSNLTGVNLPQGLTILDENTFMDCTSLEKIEVPEGIASIESYAFYNCTSLKTVTLPESLADIKKMVFYGCDKLEVVNYTGNTEQWNGISIGESNDALINAEKNFGPVKMAFAVIIDGVSYDYYSGEEVVKKLDTFFTEENGNRFIVYNWIVEGVEAEINKNDGTVAFIMPENDVVINSQVYLNGDTSGDGRISVADCFYLLKAMKSGVEEQIYDVNRDGIVSALDKLVLLQIIKGVYVYS